MYQRFDSDWMDDLLYDAADHPYRDPPPPPSQRQIDQAQQAISDAQMALSQAEATYRNAQTAFRNAQRLQQEAAVQQQNIGLERVIQIYGFNRVERLSNARQAAETAYLNADRALRAARQRLERARANYEQLLSRQRSASLSSANRLTTLPRDRARSAQPANRSRHPPRSRRGSRSSFDALDEMLGLTEEDGLEAFFSDSDAAVARSRLRTRKGIPNANCQALMQSCMAYSRRRPGGSIGYSRCQACADSCRSLGNFWPRTIPGTRMQCPQYL